MVLVVLGVLEGALNAGKNSDQLLLSTMCANVPTLYFVPHSYLTDVAFPPDAGTGWRAHRSLATVPGIPKSSIPGVWLSRQRQQFGSIEETAGRCGIGSDDRG